MGEITDFYLNEEDAEIAGDEMEKEELAKRYLADECSINGDDLENGLVKNENWQKLTAGVSNLSEKR